MQRSVVLSTSRCDRPKEKRSSNDNYEIKSTLNASTPRCVRLLTKSRWCWRRWRWLIHVSLIERWSGRPRHLFLFTHLPDGGGAQHDSYTAHATKLAASSYATTRSWRDIPSGETRLLPKLPCGAACLALKPISKSWTMGGSWSLSKTPQTPASALSQFGKMARRRSRIIWITKARSSCHSRGKLTASNT